VKCVASKTGSACFCQDRFWFWRVFVSFFTIASIMSSNNGLDLLNCQCIYWFVHWFIVVSVGRRWFLWFFAIYYVDGCSAHHLQLKAASPVMCCDHVNFDVSTLGCDCARSREDNA
jgi:hypothetical protein